MRTYNQRPFDVTEILLLLAIAAISAYVLIPKIHDYFYKVKAATVVAQYASAIKTISTAIRLAPTDKTEYFLYSRKHDGVLKSDNDNKLVRSHAEHTETRLAIGTHLLRPLTIYLSVPSYFIPLQTKVVDTYFQHDNDLRFLYQNLFHAGKPFHPHVYAGTSNSGGSTCKGYPVVVTVGMNFNLPNRSGYISTKIELLLKRKGFKPHNNMVRTAVNVQGQLCPG